MDLISRLITHCEEPEDIRGVSICQTSHWSGLQLQANMIRLGLLFWAVALPYYVVSKPICNADLTAENGVVTSPGYPGEYDNNVDCVVSITVAADKRIQLNFIAFDIEPARGCRYDYLEITDGVRAKKLCGTKRPSLYVSRTNKVVLRFKTDSSVTHKGYRAAYKSVIAPPPKPQSPINEKNCGTRVASQARVIGGVNATKGAWPWQIGMYSKDSGRFFCGGSLISPLWAVTAAHCVASSTSDEIFIQVGDLNLYTNDGTEQKIFVDEIVSHKRYGNLNYDIALLRLKKPAMMNDYVNTVCVPGETEKVAVGSNCYITGWGKIKHPGSSHPHLQQASLNVIDSQVCQAKMDKLNRGMRMTDQMVCAGVPGTIKSGCHGDSGGPFVCRDPSTNKFVLQGAVSWGSPRCNSSDTYTVFARVQALRGWINDVIKET